MKCYRPGVGGHMNGKCARDITHVPEMCLVETCQVNGSCPFHVPDMFLPVSRGPRPSVWGSRVWVRDLTTGKLDLRGREGRFIGYDAESKGCCIYWQSSCSIGVERDLIFEDQLVNSELIFLPESSPVKIRHPAPPAVPTEVPEPPPTQPSPEDVLSDEPTILEVPLQVAEPEAPTEAEPPRPSQSSREPLRRICEPLRYVCKVLEGTINGGTAQGKSHPQRVPASDQNDCNGGPGTQTRKRGHCMPRKREPSY